MKQLFAFLVLSLAVAGCQGNTIDVGDGEWTDDDATADDDDADDDAGDDDTGDDDGTYPALGDDWTWGMENTWLNANASFVGEDLGESTGFYLAIPGDVNGDGLGDLFIGDPMRDMEGWREGKVHVVFGQTIGWVAHESLAGWPAYTGEESTQELGKVRYMGDINGDGLIDVVIDPGCQCSAPPAGQHLVYGRETGWEPDLTLPSDADVTIATYCGGTDIRTRGDFGDFDGDGLDDWLTFGQAHLDGEVIVVLASQVAQGMAVPDDAAVWFYADTNQIYAMPAGDVNGDGRADMGFWQQFGERAYLVFGRDSGFPHDVTITEAADVTFTVSDFQHKVGNAISYLQEIGDVNGDGIRDLALDFSPEDAEDPRDGTPVFFGRSSWSSTYEIAESDLVSEVGAARVGDVTGDGIDDVLGGSPCSHDPGLWCVCLVPGRSGSWPSELTAADAVAWLEVPAQGRPTNFVVGNRHERRDINGDGISEWLVGSGDADWNGHPGAGVLAVFVGRESWPESLELTDADALFVGTDGNLQLGREDSTVIGDLNGDGYDDIVVASLNLPADTEAGEVFVFFGQPGP